MKVLYSCLSKSWGGMEMFTVNAVKQLLKRNIHAELLCIKESRLHIEAVNAGIITHPVKSSGYFHPYGILKIYALIRKNSYDLIHTQASKDLWLLVPALKIGRLKIPLFMTKQVGSYIVKKDIFHRWIYNRLSFALAISNVIKKNLADTCPISEDRIILLHNGVDTELFDPRKGNRNKIREEFYIKENDVLIGMMARFSPGKGHEEFLSAASELNKEYGNLKFIVVGEASRGENEYKDKIQNMSAELKLHNVIFAGFRGDTPDVFAGMDIFVFPSHNEAFGIALAEAMAMGIPSVCSDSDGILDIAVDGGTSLLFKVKNSVDLKNKIKILLNSRETRIKLGAASRERAVAEFDIKKLSDRVIGLYEKAVGK